MKFFACVALLFSAFASAQQPPVRIRLLTLYRLKQITIAPRGESSVEMNGTRRALHSATQLSAQGNLVFVEGQTSKKLRIDGDIEITAEGTRRELVNVPSEVSASHGELRIIASFPVEHYVAAVLQGETAGNMPSEPLKALAVAMRSYATRFRERHHDEGFDFCDTTHCQFVQTEISPSVLEAVKATEKEILWDRGSPLAAYYHKDCGGRTEDVAVVWPDQKSPVLISHPDPYCTRITKPWRSAIGRADIVRALASVDLHVPANWDRIVVTERTPSGRARTLEFAVGGSQQRAIVSASSFRFAMGRALGWNTLKSDWYDVSPSGDHFVFSGRGTGHGVGLCQEGAAEMAREGKTYREILAFYYPGAAIGRSAQAIPWITTPDDGFDIRVVSSADAAIVGPEARKALAWAKRQTALGPKIRPVLNVFPAVAMFRDATGEPGWVAASTRDSHIRLEPPEILRQKLPGVLRHEFLHLLIESNAKAGTPLWFREGLVLEISGEPGRPAPEMTTTQIEHAIESRADQSEMNRAYAAAAAVVRELEQEHGRAQLIGWLREGLPSGVVAVHPHKISQ